MTLFRATPASTLVITCADGRIVPVIRELLSSLGEEIADVLALPGGPALFNFWAAPFSSSDALKRAAEFLIEVHAIERVVLLAHQRCAHYGASGSERSEHEVERAQLEDLRIAKAALQAAHPRLGISSYYAVVEDSAAPDLRLSLIRVDART